ncbi:MAG: ketoacyl-ACP synthase III [Butyrivibrio sp.]|jgi:3-oxoacyl-[acyl-carrier-protein] synthase-3|nr:ketoacyl-ACP synthase III [Butyrivibrio sp.]
MNGLQIIAAGAAHPGRSVSNDDLAKVVETDDEWIYSRTGIHSRFFCEGEESCVSLAINAAKLALERSGLPAGSIGCCICATMSGDYATPGVSCLVQQALGLREDIPVMDLNAACSGFIYALETARGLLAEAESPYALIIGVEQLSRLLDMTDRSTCVLFGDGGGAVVVRCIPSAAHAAILGARGGMQICCRGAGYEHSYIEMDGKAVFRFAVEAIPKCISYLLTHAELTLEDIDYVICHQANARIIDHCVRKLKADPGKFYQDMDHFGNTSAASIPLALNEMYENGLLHPGQKLLLVGFGSGLTWGGILVSI